ncbi:MAG: cupin domain-containing protein [Gammaproteobacteria bacterium]|nr:cupin domain-containing protein [Gammaproteobacteria bacterium]
MLQKSKKQTSPISHPSFKKSCPLGKLTEQQFLSDYWHKKPLLIRQALPGFSTPINPDELAGLACEEEVEARLILEKDGPAPWTLEHGPFTEDRFAGLPETHWTLLVQEANRYIPELCHLREAFNFIPHWRSDDVMVSYAPVHGSAGPHVDQYDVFLLQGLGRRRWMINPQPVAADNLLANTDLKIMQDFQASEEWILEPGDILYLPPGVAHYGIALDECMTFSIGFRAPSHAELLSSFIDDRVAELDDSLRYADGDLQIQKNPGEITAQTLFQIRGILQQAVSEPDHINRWFGRYTTEPRHGELPEQRAPSLNPAEFKTQLEQAGGLIRSEHSRFAFIQEQEHVYLFIDGREYDLLPSWIYIAQLICNHCQLKLEMLQAWLDDQVFIELFCALYNHGKFDFPDRA